jgi:hypothetical protein
LAIDDTYSSHRSYPAPNDPAFSADGNLTDGQVITVTWSKFLLGEIVNIMQFNGDGTVSFDVIIIDERYVIWIFVDANGKK